MIVTKKYIKHLREKSFFNISEDIENIILEKLGKEPNPEEDIYEQIIKVLQAK